METSRPASISIATVLAVGFFALFYSSSGAQTAPASFSLNSASDLTSDVKFGLNTLSAHPSSQAEAEEIKNEDYKSTWDEFGMNVLIDGVKSSSQITQEIIQDIVGGIQTEQQYDKQEANYLGATQTTPEEIQAMEGDQGSDISPSEPIEPNPSLGSNPDAGVFAGEEDSTASSTEQNTPPAEASSSDAGASTASSAEVNPEPATTSSENDVFNAILQGEQPAPEQPVTPPSESAPTE